MSDSNTRDSGEELAAHGRFLRRLIAGLVRDPSDVDDVVQETFLVALESGRSRRGRLGAWLAGIAKNVARKAGRSQARRERREARAADRVEGRISDPAQLVERVEAQERVVRALRSLSEPWRSTLISRYLEERTCEEIASDTGVPASTVRSRVKRGLDLLRERLDRESGDRSRWLAPLLPFLGSAPSPVPSIGSSTAGAVVKGGIVMAGKKLLVTAFVLALVAGAVGVYEMVGLHREDRPSPKLDHVALGARGHQGGRAAALSAADRNAETPGLTGKVVDEKGHPVSGARVYAYPGGTMSRPVEAEEPTPPADPLANCESGKDGKFSVDSLPRPTVDLLCTAKGFAPRWLMDVRRGSDVSFHLAPGGRLDVAVTDVDGNPLPGVEIDVYLTGKGEWLRAIRPGLSGDDGTFSAEEVPPGNIEVSAFRFGYRRGVAGPKRLESGKELSLHVVMDRGVEVWGTVLRRSDDRPIEGATAKPSGETERAAVHSDADGRFDLRGVTRGGWYTVSAAGYCTRMLSARKDEHATIRMDPGAAVVGRVVDARGAPITDCGLEAAPFQGRDGRTSVATGADGRFRLGGLRRDADYLLVLTPGRLRAARRFHAPSRGTLDLGDASVGAGSAVRGTVTDTNGVPVWSAVVEIVPARPQFGPGAKGPTLAYLGTAHADAHGSFELGPLGAGEYEVRMTGAGAPAESKRVRVDGTHGAEVDFQVEAGASVRIRVVDARGRPLEGVLVGARDGRVQALARTDAAGVARLSGLPRCGVSVSVGSPVGRYFRERVGPLVPRGQLLTVVTAAVATISGRVTDAEGRGLERMFLEFRAKLGGSAENAGRPWNNFVMTGQDGAFRLRAPKGVDVTLDLPGAEDSGAGYRATPYRAELTGVRAPATGLEVVARRVPMTGRITVHAIREDGRPLGDVEVEIVSRAILAQEKTDEHGSVTFTGLPAAEVKVVGGIDTVDSTVVAPLPRHLFPSGQVVTLVYRAGAELRGTVLLWDGGPAKKVYVSAVPVGKWMYTIDTRSDSEGRFHLFVLPGVPQFLMAVREGPHGKQIYAFLSGVRAGESGVVLRFPKPQ